MQTLWIGVDIAKETLQAAALVTEQTTQDRSFPNTPSGRKSLIDWAKKIAGQRQIKICMESTGAYGKPLAEELCQQGIWVAVLNPRTVKHFAISLQMRNKNDLVDARLIARFGKERNPKPWNLSDPIKREIDQLKKQISRLQKVLNLQSNPKEDKDLPKHVIDSIKRMEKTIQNEIAKLQKRIQELIQKDEKLQSMVHALVQIPGVGELTAIEFLCAVDVEAFDNAQDVAAYAGLNPSQKQSGKNPGRTTVSRQGNPRLRKAFHFPGICASRYFAPVKALRQRLEEKKHRWSAVRTACTRKLIMICWGVANRVAKGLQPFYQA